MAETLKPRKHRMLLIYNYSGSGFNLAQCSSHRSGLYRCIELRRAEGELASLLSSVTQSCSVNSKRNLSDLNYVAWLITS